MSTELTFVIIGYLPSMVTFTIWPGPPRTNLHPRMGHRPNYLDLNGSVDRLAPTIAPQNLAFRLLGREGGFWRQKLVPIRVLGACPWRFSIPILAALNFGNTPVFHALRWDVNQTVEGLSRFGSGNFTAHDPHMTIKAFSNWFRILPLMIS